MPKFAMKWEKDGYGGLIGRSNGPRGSSDVVCEATIRVQGREAAFPYKFKVTSGIGPFQGGAREGGAHTEQGAKQRATKECKIQLRRS